MNAETLKRYWTVKFDNRGQPAELHLVARKCRRLGLEGVWADGVTVHLPGPITANVRSKALGKRVVLPPTRRWITEAF